MAKSRALIIGDDRLPQRFWDKVIIDENDCWLWQAGRNGGDCYGNFWLDGRTQSAHKVAYEHLVAPVPKGLELDHQCEVMHCVNPGHLIVTTHPINVTRSSRTNAQKTHCSAGHPYDSENTYIWHGERRCRACQLETARRYRERQA